MQRIRSLTTIGELVAALRVALGEQQVTLDVALSNLQAPDREIRCEAAEAVSAALEPGLRTRAQRRQARILLP